MLGIAGGYFGIEFCVGMIIFKARELGMFRNRQYFLIFLLIFISGCATATVISPDLRAKVDSSLTFREVQQNPNQHKGKFVLWGGEILQTLPQKDGTILIEVLEWPLGWRGEPQRTVTFRGKFLVFVKEHLYLLLYKRGEKVTVAGEIQGEILGEEGKSLTDITYRYPFLLSKQIYLWKDYPQYSTPYDPRRYDPSYDPHRGAGILRY